MDAVLKFGRTAALLVLALSAAAQAQPSRPTYRIGFLSLAATPPQNDPLIDGLRRLGYLEQRDVVVEHRFAGGDAERLKRFADELARSRVDVIVATATPAAQAAQRATSTVPIVFWAVVDPVGAGLVASLSRPGANITGLSLVSADLAGKRLELLQGLIPKLTRVGVLHNSSNASNALQLKEITAATRQRGVEMRAFDVRTRAAIEQAIGDAAQAPAQAILALDDQLIFAERKRIAELAGKHALASMFGLKDFVEAGGLMSYGANGADQLRRVSLYLDRIFKGARPGDLPVEQPTSFELVINAKTARSLGLTIPADLLLRADAVLQ
ncbi:MAG TPA: ABC transporter substrate-binding protein [Burkholderiales bacterium]|nr:ABC transporter substrate-binding protein [Burkholderiales bacterium]